MKNKNLNIPDISSLIILNLMIQKLNEVKLGIETKKINISKQTWKDFKVLYEHQYTKYLDDFFNNI